MYQSDILLVNKKWYFLIEEVPYLLQKLQFKEVESRNLKNSACVLANPQEIMLWQQKGNQGNKWREANVHINSATEWYLIIEGKQ